jgi:hypothetical protein
MTEQEWLTTGDWLALWFHSDEIGLRTERKTHLFAVAACRRIGRYLTDPRSLRSLEVCERFADGAAGEDELEEACSRAQEASYERRPAAPGAAATAAFWLCSGYKIGRAVEAVPDVYGYEAAIAAGVLSPDPIPQEGPQAIWQHPTFRSGVAVGDRIQADFLREVIGNPFRQVTLDPAWLSWNGGTVQRIAQAIYDERSFERMPIMADALEDAGCDNADILAHCRSGGEHVRGCWVVDLLLGKT